MRWDSDGDGRLRWLPQSREDQARRCSDAEQWRRRHHWRRRCWSVRRATEGTNRLEEPRHRGEPLRLELGIEWLGRGTLDGEGSRAAAPNELGERIEMVHVGGVKQIAHVGLGEHAVAQEGSGLSSDGIALLADGWF